MTTAPPYLPDAVCETHEWLSAAGETIRFVTRTDATQRMMPPTTIWTTTVPLAQGGMFLGARHEERLVAIPVVVPGPQTDRAELRRWARALDPLKGEGTLTVVQGPNAGRMIPCAYEAGLDSYAEEWPSIGLTTLVFHAADPYWRDSTETALTANLGQNLHTWFPFLPLILGASDIFASVNIPNTGDVDTWPIVTAVGPGQDLTVTNQTTGAMWHVTGPVAAGDTVIVDTRPGHRTVTVNGNNAFARLDFDSRLWPLVAGTNRIDIAFAAATAATSVRFAWRNRYLAA